MSHSTCSITSVSSPNHGILTACDCFPSESAIVLDLLMSLPEELPLLDCNKLHNHLIQVQLSTEMIVFIIFFSFLAVALLLP